jgi:hypothetical protein
VFLGLLLLAGWIAWQIMEVRNSRVMQRRGSIFGLKEIAANSCLTAMPSDNGRPIALAEDPGSTRPERHFPSGAAQTRTVSVAIFRLDLREAVRTFKGIICGDISEFESRSQDVLLSLRGEHIRLHG